MKLKKIKKGIQNPKSAWQRISHVTNNKVRKYRIQRKYGQPVDFMEKDWDNLIILDACRYDIFNEIVNKSGLLEGCLHPVVSNGSNSLQVIQNNMSNSEFYDTVYVTVNPNIDNINETESIFYKIQRTYDVDMGEKKRLGYFPKQVYDTALETYRKYPNKKLIVHFMQPHAPFITDKAKNIEKELYQKYGVRIWRSDIMFDDYDEDDFHVENWYQLVENSLISKQMVRELYNENLKYVLSYVTELQDYIEGKTIITSDHGELLGEDYNAGSPSGYGHPGSLFCKELRLVPWFELKSSSRREICADEPLTSSEPNSKSIEKNLEALGYK